MSVHLIIGNDKYLVDKKIKDMIKESGVDEFNVVTYDIEESPFSMALSDAQTIPFMSERKLVIVKHIDFKEKEGFNENDLVTFLDDVPSFSDLIIVPNKKLDNKKKIVKMLKKVANVHELNKVDDSQLEQAAIRFLMRRDIEIEKDALKELMTRTEGDTQRVMNELSKLENYFDNDGTVKIEHIKDLVSKNVEDDVFQLINSIVDRNTDKSLEIYHDLLQTEDPVRLIGLIINKFRELNYAKTLVTKGYKKDDVMTFFNASSGRAYYIMKSASSVSFDYIQNQLDRLSKVDIDIKKGLIDKKIGLELYLLRI
ncbi:DNA polymerase III subunit delta [Mycoplasmatota bacterium WC44]